MSEALAIFNGLILTTVRCRAVLFTPLLQRRSETQELNDLPQARHTGRRNRAKV